MKFQVTLAAAAILAAGPAFADMGDYDSDADGMLNEMEFGEAEGQGRFMEYDADESGDVSEEEFAAGEFRRYDTDRDEMVSEAEYARFEEDTGNMASEQN